MSVVNRRWVLRSRPSGRPVPDNFAIQPDELAEPSAGEVLVRVRWVAIEAGRLNRLRDEPSYVAPMQLGDTMTGTGVGEVIASRDPRFRPGEFVTGPLNWQEFALVAADALEPSSTGSLPPSAALGLLGISGLTAYLGLYTVGRPRPGETVLISAAAGSVGLIAGQLAALHGCRVIGLTSTAEKAGRLVSEFGYSDAVDYRSAADLTSAIRAAARKGVGNIAEAVLPLYNDFARIVVCGRVNSFHLTDTRKDIGQRDSNTILIRRIRKEGFLVFDHLADTGRIADIRAELESFAARRSLTLPVHASHGFESFPAAMTDLLEGRNFGQQLVELNT
jgi:NADPH-dependent curcumin reductase CurA